jgi:predicted GTPase
MYIQIIGGRACGKTAMASEIYKLLKEAGYDVVVVPENRIEKEIIVEHKYKDLKPRRVFLSTIQDKERIETSIESLMRFELAGLL